MKKFTNRNNREETLRNPMNICSKNIEKLSHPDTERKLCELTIRDGAMYLPLQVNNQTGQIMTVCNANPEATLLDKSCSMIPTHPSCGEPTQVINPLLPIEKT